MSRRARFGRSRPAPTRCVSDMTSSTSRSSRCATRSSTRFARADSPSSGSWRRPAASPTLRHGPLARLGRSASIAPPAERRHVGRCGATARCGSTGPALVVELVPEVGMAAGRLSQLPGEWFRETWCRTPTCAASRKEPSLRRRARRPPARRHRARRAPARVGASCDRRADRARLRRDRHRDRPPALAAASRGGICRDPRRRARERGSRPPRRYTRGRDAGWSSLVARRAHNPEVAGSNPAPATGKAPETGLFCSHGGDQPAELLPNFCLDGCDAGPSQGSCECFKREHARTVERMRWSGGTDGWQESARTLRNSVTRRD